MRSTSNLGTVLHAPLGERPLYTGAEPPTRYGDRCGFRRMLARLARMTACVVTLAMMAACQSSAGDVQRGADSSTGTTQPGTAQPGDGAGIDVGQGPCCLVVRDDGVWVMNLRDETIQRIDPDTNEPDEPIDVSPLYKMIDAGEDMLLEGDESVTLFDPKTATVGQSIAVEGGVRGMVYDSMSNTAWVGSATDGTLIGIDAEGGRVVDTLTIDGLPSGGDLVMTGKSELWVATFDGEILKVDLAERRVVTRLRRFVGNEVSIAPAGGYLWATSVQQPTLFRINPDTGDVVERGDIDAAGAGFPGVATSPDGTLWVAAAPDRIEERDPQTGQTLKSYDIPLDDDVHINEYFRNSGTTGFGSVWTTTFDKYSFDHAVVRLER